MIFCNFMVFKKHKHKKYNMKKLILTSLIVFLFVFIAQRVNSIDWNSDLDFLKVELPKKHANFYHKGNEKQFFDGIESIRSTAGKYSDLSVALKIQQLIASFGDSHTNADLSKFLDNSKVLPIHLLWLKDGIYILHTTPENKVILEHRIVKINGNPITEVIDSLSTLFTIDNDAAKKNTIYRKLVYVQLLQYFNFATSEDIVLELENSDGKKLTHTIRPAVMTRSNRVSFKPSSLAFCNMNEKAFFIDSIMRNDNAYYIQYNSCWSREYPYTGFNGNPENLPSFIQFRKKVIETLKRENFDKIIFDMRFNGGGNSSQGTELIKEMAAMDNVNVKGKLYVITGRLTFSSAIINTMDFMKMTKAIFVGEETTGKPNHYGEVKSFVLPFSGMTVSYSTKYFRNSDKDLKTITPDKIVETTFNDLMTGKDPVYDWIIMQ